MVYGAGHKRRCLKKTFQHSSFFDTLNQGRKSIYQVNKLSNLNPFLEPIPLWNDVLGDIHKLCRIKIGTFWPPDIVYGRPLMVEEESLWKLAISWP